MKFKEEENPQGEFERLPEAEYMVEVVECKDENERFNFQFKILGGKYSNRRFFTTLWQTGEKANMFINLAVRCLDVKIRDGEDLTSDHFIGRNGKITLSHYSYTKKGSGEEVLSERIGKWLPKPKSESTTATPPPPAFKDASEKEESEIPF